MYMNVYKWKTFNKSAKEILCHVGVLFWMNYLINVQMLIFELTIGEVMISAHQKATETHLSISSEVLEVNDLLPTSGTYWKNEDNMDVGKIPMSD